MADDPTYVVPTGRGYRATYAISPGRTVTLSSAVLEDGVWTGVDRARAIAHDDGVALVPAAGLEAEPIAEYALNRGHNAGSITVGQRAVDALGLEPAADVRVYDLAVDDRVGLLLVDAAADPRLDCDRPTEGTR